MKDKTIKRLAAGIVLAACCLASAAQTKTVTHEIQRGETIESIAKKYGVTVEAIKQTNPNAGDYFFAGMKIKVPTSEQFSPNNKTATTNETYTTYKAAQTTKDATTEQYPKVIEPEAQPINDKSYTRNSKFFMDFLYQSESKVYGLNFGTDIGKYLLATMMFNSNLKFGSQDISTSSVVIGVGAKQRFVFNDMFLLQIEIYPYIGLSYYGQQKIVGVMEAEDKTEFEYGAIGDIGAGLKLWTTPKGNSTFLTVGYMVSAGRFKTEGMFKYGSLKIGITTILN